MIYLTNDPYPQEISIPRSFGVIVPRRTEYLTRDDIATDLETDSDRKILAASQGVRLKEMIDGKADADDVYTKTEVDDALAEKANVEDIPAAVEANPTIPAGVTPVDLQNLKVGDDFFSVPQGGGGVPEIFWAKYSVTTSQEIDQAIADGKFVVAIHNTTGLCVYTGSNNSYHFFGSVYSGNYVSLRLSRTNDVWGYTTAVIQINGNLSQSVPTDHASTSKYPSVKAVFDSLGKWGVVSQTQTWTGSSTTGYDYTMSDPVWGLIPQANIDLYTAAGAVFNESTGYFELNGLTDISYQEMTAIFNHKIMTATDYTNEGIFNSNVPVRTILPITSWGANQSVNSSQAFANGSRLETARLSRQSTYPLRFVAYSSFFINSKWLREVIDIIQVTGGAAQNTIFSGCSSLVTAKIAKIERNTTFKDSPRLSLESVVYAVANANNSTAITITLHATAYARCQADTTEYTYNGQTYTGIIAYAAAKNISIVSA